MIIRLRRIRYSVIEQARALLHEGEYIVRQQLDSFTLLMIVDSSFQRRVEQILAISPDFEQACIGIESADASLAASTAGQTFDVCHVLKTDQRIIHFYEI